MKDEPQQPPQQEAAAHPQSEPQPVSAVSPFLPEELAQALCDELDEDSQSDPDNPMGSAKSPWTPEDRSPIRPRPPTPPPAG
ncbi:hypothetical protein ACPESV_45810 [Streptomyces umbrinus]|uniref:hypothetical protein n=1 Tax=Streptomyces umbrinus TaxID=67370 RepID=UPI003C2DD165|nr:hypothetical protein [Streptomyces phaeochromogenes]